jgi:hypothetical protein
MLVIDMPCTILAHGLVEAGFFSYVGATQACFSIAGTPSYLRQRLEID